LRRSRVIPRGGLGAGRQPGVANACFTSSTSNAGICTLNDPDAVTRSKADSCGAGLPRTVLQGQRSTKGDGVFTTPSPCDRPSPSKTERAEVRSGSGLLYWSREATDLQSHTSGEVLEILVSVWPLDPRPNFQHVNKRLSAGSPTNVRSHGGQVYPCGYLVVVGVGGGARDRPA